MARRNETMIKVKDPKGELFEVSRRNAMDLVQHRGWTYVREVEDFTNDEKAQAPRQRIPRGQKLADSRKLAAEQKTVLEQPPATKKRGKKAESVAAEEPVVIEETADMSTFDETGAALDLSDELDELEAEEDARGKH